MRAIDYPEMASHRCEHALLLAEYIEMVRDLERQSLIQLDSETVQSLHHWLVSHMVGADRDYADYYFSILGQKQTPPGGRRTSTFEP
jgi:hemerythrin